REKDPGPAEVLDDLLVGEGARRDPGHVLEAAGDRLFAVALAGSVGGDEPEAALDGEDARRPGPGKAGRRLRGLRRAGAAQQREEVGGVLLQDGASLQDLVQRARAVAPRGGSAIAGA